MIIRTAVLQFPAGSCSPQYFTSSNHYGPAIIPTGKSGSRGHHWRWPGPAPHPTRMHRYASLTAPQKAAWEALANEMANDHSPHGITAYNGPIAFMQTNLFRRLQGMAYTDDAPSTGGDPGETTGLVQQDGTPSGPVDLTHTP